MISFVLSWWIIEMSLRILGKTLLHCFQGQREAAINVAEGRKQSQILASEARKMEQINIATGNQRSVHLIVIINTHKMAESMSPVLSQDTLLKVAVLLSTQL